VGKAHDCEVSRERYKDTDPVNLVFMFAFPERALIILRGKIDHIRQAKRVIREYDVPAPMARVTLWSLEMNSDATPKGTKHLNAALAAIDEEFALTRAQIDATLSILRDAVNEEVTTRAEAAYAGEVGRPPFGATSLEGYLDDTMSCLAMRDPTFKRYFAYPSIVRTSLGFNTDYPLYGEYLLREWASDVERGVLIDSADGYREWTESIDNGNWHEQWEPRTRDNSTLSDSPWLQEALPREDAWTSEGQASFTRAQLRASLEEYYGLMSTVIPDPVAVNTVGEAMLMLNLLDTESRARILRQFETKLNAYLRENCMWRASGHWCGDETGCCNDAPLSFHRLVRALGIDEYSGQSGAGGLAGKQIAVIQAIKRYHIRRLMGAAGGLILAADRQEVEYRQLFNLWIARELENSSAADVSEFMGKPDKNRDDPRVFKLPVTQDIMTTISTGLKRKLREMVDVGDIPPMYVGYLDACIDNLVGSRTQLSGGTVPADSAQRYVPVEHWELYNAKRLFSYMSQDELADAIVKRMWLNRKTLEAARPVQYWVVNELRADPDVLSDVLERSFNAEREAWWRDDNWDKRGTAEQFDHDCYILREILDQVYEQYVGDNPYRQVAKGDELLKELNKAMEDELDTHFVQPMLQRLRQRLLGTGVSVGALQRTSMLVTNRKRSRIEPLASAQLRMGEDVSLLPELQLLDDIYQIAQQGNVRDVLDVLAKLEGEDDTTEVYGVTSGNRFVVTPVFDPTGQAYRFTFDHLYTNRIRDPDGTTSQGTLNLPRTERLSLNTDVQLSNFEIREVARFESNARLGIAPSESGGIPVLRHVPLLRELPLIGWFKRRTGKAAIVQQTVIFAQTTMYPTIDEIVPLMTSSILVVGDRQN